MRVQVMKVGTREVRCVRNGPCEGPGYYLSDKGEGSYEKRSIVEPSEVVKEVQSKFTV